MKSYALFIRTGDIWSPVIRTVTWSPWSHVATVLNKNIVYESLFKTGVVRTTMDAVLKRATKFEFVEYNTDNRLLLEFLEMQVGKPYDWTAVIGIGLHRDWQEDDSWYCSELHAAACLHAGVLLVDKKASRVTPYDVYTSPIGKKFGVGVVPDIV